MKSGIYTSFVTIICVISMLLSSQIVAAQPDSGSLLREAEKQLSAPVIQPKKPAAESQQAEAVSRGPKILVKGYVIEGAKAIPAEQLQQQLKPYVDKELNIGQIKRAISKLSSYYQSKGLVAAALLPQQEIKDGIIRVLIIEGVLEGIDIDAEGAKRFDPKKSQLYLQNRLKPGDLLDQNKIDEAVLLLNDLAGVKVRAVLQPGEKKGSGRILLITADTPLFTGSISADNKGIHSTGEARANANISANNISGIGDQAVFNLTKTQGSLFGQIGYALPLGTSGLILSGHINALKYKLIKDFEFLNVTGSAVAKELNMRYPIVRSRAKNLTLKVGAKHIDLRDKFSGDSLFERTVKTGVIGFSGDRRDGWMGGGVNYGGVEFISGRVAVKQGGNARDSFEKIAMNYLRQQIIQDDLWVNASLSGQYAFNNLFSSEKFSLGGSNGVRAYPSGEASGDHGALLQLTLAHRLQKDLIVSAFYDYGWINRSAEMSPGWNAFSTVPREYALKGVGIGVNWNCESLHLSGSVAQRIGDNPAADFDGKDSDNTKREPRAWISLTVPF